jgi:hypothetical protein
MNELRKRKASIVSDLAHLDEDFEVCGPSRISQSGRWSSSRTWSDIFTAIRMDLGNLAIEPSVRTTLVKRMNNEGQPWIDDDCFMTIKATLMAHGFIVTSSISGREWWFLTQEGSQAPIQLYQPGRRRLDCPLSSPKPMLRSTDGRPHIM